MQRTPVTQPRAARTGSRRGTEPIAPRARKRRTGAAVQPAPRRLPLGSLRVFVCVAEHLNFTRAGEALGVTAGAASLQIRALEEYLSRPLFRRNGRVVELTAEGAELLPRVQQALGDIERALAATRGDPAWHRGVAGRCRREAARRMARARLHARPLCQTRAAEAARGHQPLPAGAQHERALDRLAAGAQGDGRYDFTLHGHASRRFGGGGAAGPARARPRAGALELG